MKLKIATFVIVGVLSFLGMSQSAFAMDFNGHPEYSLPLVEGGVTFPYVVYNQGYGVLIFYNTNSVLYTGLNHSAPTTTVASLGYILRDDVNGGLVGFDNNVGSGDGQIVQFVCSDDILFNGCSTDYPASENFRYVDASTSLTYSSLSVVNMSDDSTFYNGQTLGNFTHLISISPIATTTATTTTLSFSGYVSSSDFGTSTQVVAIYSSPNCSAIAGSAIDAFNGSCNFSITLPVLASGAFFLSTTTTFQYGGVWNEVVSLQNASSGTCIFGFCFGAQNSLLSQLSGSFIVGSLGPFDIIQAYVASSGQSVAAGVASTSAAVSSLCNPFSGSFNVSTCLYVLVIPSGSDMKTFFSGVSGQFVQYAPWGYISRFIAIVSNNVSTTSLPCLCLVIPSVAPFPQAMWGTSFDFTPWGAFSSSSVLVSTVSPIDGKTFTGIITPYWDFIWGVLVVFAIVFRLLGVPFPSTGDHGSLSDQGSSDDSYRLKEYLYKNRKQ